MPGPQTRLEICCNLEHVGFWFKIMYFTAGFPYIVLVIFFGRAITLKGAADGLRFLFTPQMGKLLDPIVWLDAATQIFTLSDWASGRS